MTITVFETDKFIIKQTRRDYVLIRKGLPYEKHAHFKRLEGCRKLINLYNRKILPSNDYFKVAMHRVTTEEEFNCLTSEIRKQKYYNSKNRSSRGCM